MNLTNLVVGVFAGAAVVGLYGFIKSAIVGMRQARRHIAYLEGRALAREHVKQLHFSIDPLLSKEANYDRLVDYIEDEAPEMPYFVRQQLLDAFYEGGVYEEALEMQFANDLEDLSPEHFEDK